MPKFNTLTVVPSWSHAFLLALGLFASWGIPAAHGQGTAAKPVAVVKPDTLTTADGWSIPITYYQSDKGKDASVVVLLHGEGENELLWKQKTNLAPRLHADKFAVVTCDLRKHGMAKNPRAEGAKGFDAMDYKAMAGASKFSELEVIQDFLFEEHQAGRLNMAKLGLLAVDNMAPVALNWAANDWTKKPHQDAPTLSACTPRGQTVRAMAFLSPTEVVGGLSATPPLRWFKLNTGTNVSFLFVNGAEDGTTRDMKSMLKQLSTPKNKSVIFSESFPSKLKGGDLIGRVPKADALIVGFFVKQLNDIDVPWADRRSRLER